jgi:UTP-glucose-1-phosphate uridylyltransferase
MRPEAAAIGVSNPCLHVRDFVGRDSFVMIMPDQLRLISRSAKKSYNSTIFDVRSKVIRST